MFLSYQCILAYKINISIFVNWIKYKILPQLAPHIIYSSFLHRKLTSQRTLGRKSK